MDAITTKYVLLQRVNKIANLTSPGIDDRRLSAIINTAQDRRFFQKYNPQANKYGAGAEYNEKRRRELSEFINRAWIPLYTDSTPDPINSDNITYTCTVSDIVLTGDDATGRLVTISNNDIANLDTVVDNSIYDNSSEFILGLTVGQTIKGTVGNTNSFTILNILSSNQIEIDGDGTGMTEFTSGLGLSSNQYGKHKSRNIDGFIVDLPPYMLYSLEESVVTTEEPREMVDVTPITHDYINANKNNPFAKPYKNLVWRLDIDSNVKGLGNEDETFDTVTNIYQRAKSAKRIELITAKNKYPTLYYITYFKYPRRFVVDEDTPSNNVSLEWDESVHEDIIDEAVKIYLAIADPQKYQIGQAEANSSE